jgi:hypothetical protein
MGREGKLLTILVLVGLLSSIQCCEDSTSAVDVGRKKKFKCLKIKRKFPNLCKTKNIVKMSCGNSCGTCDYDPYQTCKDTKGKFSVGSSRKKCNIVSNQPNLCDNEIYKINCPKSCDLCTNGGGSGVNCPGSDPNCCQGLMNTCDLRIDEMFFAAMHNANNDDNKWNSNHKEPLEEALNEGFRAFYLDVCICRGKVVFCHGNCFYAGQQDPTEVFTNVNRFLTNNPSELVIFNFEMSFGTPTPMDIWNLMVKVNGLKAKSYIHDGGRWPKVKDLLDDGKQIISFKHNGGNCLNTSSNGCTPYIQEFFKYTVGTNYDFNSIAEIENAQESCIGHRGIIYNREFFAINNFVTSGIRPHENHSEELNKYSFAKKRIKTCEKIMEMKANFLAVDFWHHGHVPHIAREINTERGETKRRKK